MFSILLTILILLLIPFLILIFFSRYSRIYENFVNEDKDNFTDILYTKLFNIVFNHLPLIQEDTKQIQHFLETNKIPPNAPILELGTGTGKHYSLLSKYYTNITGADISQNALDLAETLTPQGKFIKANMNVQNAFQKEEFQVILTLMETLYYAKSEQDLKEAFINIQYWLKPGGYFITHLFDPTRLDPSPRDFSMLYDKDKEKHALTYFNDFTHDAWWSPQNDDSSYIYTQKFILENGRVLIKPTRFYIPQPKTIITLLEELGFKLMQVKSLNGEDTIKLYMFKLNNTNNTN